MNSNNQPSRNSFPHLNTVADARVFLDTIRADLSYSWNAIEHVLKTLQDKTNQIESLHDNLAERNSRITQMNGILINMQNQIQEKDNIIRQRDHFIQQQQFKIQHFTSWNKEMQAQIASYEESRQLLLTENADLKAKLSQGGEQSRAVVQGPKLTEEEQKALEGAIKRELIEKSSQVNAKAKECIVQVMNKSRQRITELQEQLRLLKAQTGVVHNIDSLASGHLIESEPYNETISNLPKNAMVPNLIDGSSHYQQQSAEPGDTRGYSSSSNNHNVASSFAHPPQP